jgi:hypothetical protein
MGSTTIQARHGEDVYPIGRFILDRTRALGLSRTELLRRLGDRKIGNGHKALAELLTTGTVPRADYTASRLRAPSRRGTRRDRHGDTRPAAARRGGSTHSRPRDGIQDRVPAASALRNRARDTWNPFLSLRCSQVSGCGWCRYALRLGTRALTSAIDNSKQRSRNTTADTGATCPHLEPLWATQQ